MNIDDFRYMWRGKQPESLLNEQSHLLAPVNIRHQHKGRALLLLHGFSSTPAVYRHLIPALTMYDAVVCPALPGHADSFDSFSKARASEWLAAVEQTCAELFRDYQTVDVMGLSLGGLLACHLSNKFPLNHLYLLAPALVLRLKIATAFKCARMLQQLGFKALRNLAGNIYTPGYRELAYRQLPLAAIAEVLTLIHTFKFIPPTGPTDLFLGTFDEVVNSNAVAQRFANLPNVNTHWLHQSAHVLPLDGDVEFIIECVRNNSRFTS